MLVVNDLELGHELVRVIFKTKKLLLGLYMFQVLNQRMTPELIFAQWGIVSKDKEALHWESKAIFCYDVHSIETEERIKT